MPGEAPACLQGGELSSNARISIIDSSIETRCVAGVFID